MTTAVQTVSNNIRALMDNSIPRVSQKRIGEVIDLKQPQISLRLSGAQPWGIDELDAIAQLFGVPLTLLVDPDPSAVYRWLAENGRVKVSDERIRPLSCSSVEQLDLFSPTPQAADVVSGGVVWEFSGRMSAATPTSAENVANGLQRQLVA